MQGPQDLPQQRGNQTTQLPGGLTERAGGHPTTLGVSSTPNRCGETPPHCQEYQRVRPRDNASDQKIPNGLWALWSPEPGTCPTCKIRIF